MGNSSNLRFFFCNFHPGSSIFSILQFLGTFSHNILYEDGHSSPICYTIVFSLVELDLPIDWLSIIVFYEVQAHAVTQSMRILNFIASNSGSPSCAHSDIIFSEKKFSPIIACRALR